jgi:hypothetical protein
MLQQISTVYYKPNFRITDSKGCRDDGTVRIQGQVSTEEEKSQKGYRYLTGHWPKMIGDKSTQDLIQSKQMLGQIEHPTDSDGDWNYLSTPYDKASHIVTRAWIDSRTNNPWAELALLNNEHGNNVKALVTLGHQPGVSTRGLGEVKTDSIGDYIDDQNYSLITWDIVRSPNFPALRMKPVSDSLSNTPQFQQYVQMFQLRDSGSTAFNREKLLKQIEEMTWELKRLTALVETTLK